MKTMFLSITLLALPSLCFATDLLQAKPEDKAQVFVRPNKTPTVYIPYTGEVKVITSKVEKKDVLVKSKGESEK